MSLLRELERGGWLRAIDHAFAASLLRLDPDTSDAVASAAALTSRALANGHSCLRIANVTALLQELAPDRPQPALPSHDEWLAALRASRWIGVASDDTPEDRLHGVPLVLEHDALYLRRYRDYEWRLAHALTIRSGVPSLDANDTELSKRMCTLFPASDSAVDLQALATLLALSSPLSLITGGPGTGKTSVIARLLVLLVEHAQRNSESPPRIALAAPTGKAAARLAEAVRENLDTLLARGAITQSLVDAIPASAQTVHRLLGWRSDSIEFRHDANNPLAADVVIIDEASMIDLPLMTRLVDAVPAQARLILLGDRDQLASVETGDVLAALCDAAGDGRAFAPAFAVSVGTLLGKSVPVLVNDGAPATVRSVLAGHRVDLQRSYRQHTDFDLAPLAAAVRIGDAQGAIDGLRAQAHRGVEWLQPDGREPWPWLQAHALPQFRALAQATEPQVALRMARELRLLTALRHGPCGSETLNAQIASALRPRIDGAFHGQLLMVTQNSYAQGLFNGDTGVVWGEGASAQVFFQTDEGLRAWPLAQLPAHEPAWALTVHKAQGSEFERVVLLLPDSDARVLGRELLYTGITRCRNGLVLWASESTLRNAIGRRGQRASGLARRFTARSTAHTDTPSEQASR